ncbi:MAG: hypothetical protein CMF52_07030 [Legionellales bacterium]|nr:hypothetical protein [Legionellales bacterium]
MKKNKPIFEQAEAPSVGFKAKSRSRTRVKPGEKAPTDVSVDQTDTTPEERPVKYPLGSDPKETGEAEGEVPEPTLARRLLSARRANNKSCFEDLSDNAIYYVTAGTIQVVLLWPLASAATTAAGGTVKQIAKYLAFPTTAREIPSEFRRAIRTYRQFKEAGGSIPEAAGRKVATIMGEIAKPFKDAIGGVVETFGASGWGKVSTGFKNAPKIVWSSLKATAIVGLIATLGVKALRKTLNSEDLSSQEIINKHGSSMGFFVDALESLAIAEFFIESIFYKLDQLEVEKVPIAGGVIAPALTPKVKIDDSCRLYNTVAGGVLSLFIIGMAKAGVRSFKGGNLSSMIDKAFKLKIEELDKIVLKSIVSTGNRFGLKPSQSKRYYELLTATTDDTVNNERAYEFLKQIFRNENKAAKAHEAILLAAVSKSDDFILRYSASTADDITEARSLLSGASRSVTALKTELNTALAALYRSIAIDSIRPAAAVSSSSAGFAVDFAAVSRFASRAPRTMDDLAAIGTKLDDAVLAGELSLFEALSIYNRSYRPVVQSFGDELKFIVNKLLPAGSSIARSSEKIINSYLSKLKALNARPEVFSRLASKLDMHAGGAKAAANVNKLTPSAREVNDLLFLQILRSSPRIDPKDLARLRSELSKFNKLLAEAIRIRSIEKGDVASSIAIYGLTAAVTYEIFADEYDIDDLNRWRSDSLASALAFDDYGIASLATDSIEKTNKEVLQRITGAGGIFDVNSNAGRVLMKTLFSNYIYNNSDDKMLAQIVNLRKLQKQNKPKEVTEKANEIVINFANKLSNADEVKRQIITWLDFGEDNVEKNYDLFNNKWIPIIIKIAVTNSALRNNIIELQKDSDFRRMPVKTSTDKAKIKDYILEKVFSFSEADIQGIGKFIKIYNKGVEKVNQINKNKKTKVPESTQLVSNDFLRELVKQQLNEGKNENYSSWPYVSGGGDDMMEPTQDYMELWKSFSREIFDDKSRDKSVALAKILIKNLDLFDEALELIGKNQSVGEQIMSLFQDSYEPPEKKDKGCK